MTTATKERAMTYAIEKRYLDAKAAADAAKKELRAAKEALLDAHGLKPCRPCTEDEAATYADGKIEGSLTIVTHFAKSASRWDSKKLEKLSETVPVILEARSIDYKIEARVRAKPNGGSK
jgi:hypothetical protein